MRSRPGLAYLIAGCLVASTAAAQLNLGTKPVRVILLVDSSSAVGSMINPMRAALNAFLDGLPEDAEVGFITTGGQIRIRTQPTSDRDKLHKAASGFAPDGGGNAFVDTLLEADQRFLRRATDRRHVFVMVTTDEGFSIGQGRVDDYNKFMNDFLQRRGRAYGIVLRGQGIGPTSEIVNNLATNTNGTYEVINSPNSLPDKMKAIAARISNEP